MPNNSTNFRDSFHEEKLSEDLRADLPPNTKTERLDP